jgi:hypothetical protein
MIDTSCAKLFANLVRRCEPEVSYGDMEAIVEAQDVLGFQITVINTQRMTIFHCIKQLEENPFDEIVVTEVAAIVKDLGE